MRAFAVLSYSALLVRLAHGMGAAPGTCVGREQVASYLKSVQLTAGDGQSMSASSTPLRVWCGTWVTATAVFEIANSTTNATLVNSWYRLQSNAGWGICLFDLVPGSSVVITNGLYPLSGWSYAMCQRHTATAGGYASYYFELDGWGGGACGFRVTWRKATASPTTLSPTPNPSTASPSLRPSSSPSTTPTSSPAVEPTASPAVQLTASPSSGQPSGSPSTAPTAVPSSQPSAATLGSGSSSGSASSPAGLTNTHLAMIVGGTAIALGLIVVCFFQFCRICRRLPTPPQDITSASTSAAASTKQLLSETVPLSDMNAVVPDSNAV